MKKFALTLTFVVIVVYFVAAQAFFGGRAPVTQLLDSNTFFVSLSNTTQAVIRAAPWGIMKRDISTGVVSIASNALQTAIDGKQPLDADLTALAGISGVQGDVIYHNGTSWVRLGAGSSGQFLQSQGAGANPQWATTGAGGSQTPWTQNIDGDGFGISEVSYFRGTTTNLTGTHPTWLLGTGPQHARVYPTNDMMVHVVVPANANEWAQGYIEFFFTNSTPYSVTISNAFALAGNELVTVGGTNTYFWARWNGTNVSVGSLHARNVVSDVAVGSGWNGDGTNAPSKNALHDYFALFDPNLNGLPTNLESATNSGNFAVGGVVASGNGSVGAPTYSFHSDPDTGLYRFGANALGFAAGGSLSLWVDASTLSSTNLAVGGNLSVGNGGHAIISGAVNSRPGIIGLSDTNFDAGVKWVFLHGPHTASSNWALRLPASAGSVGQALSISSLSSSNVLLGWSTPGSTVTVREEDGSPSVSASEIRFTNGSVTDNGGGSVSVTTSGSGSGDSALVNATGVTDSFSLSNKAATATSPATTFSISANGDPDPDIVQLDVGPASATDAGVVTAQAQTLAGIKSFTQGATAGGAIKLTEDTDNGSNVITVKAPDTIASDKTATFPDATGTVVLEDNTATFTGKTYDASATGNTLKFIDYRDFVYPGKVDGAGCTIVTNDYTSNVWGLASYAGNAGTNGNYAIFRVGVVPRDLDTGVDLVLKDLAIRVSGTDTDQVNLSIAFFGPASSSGHMPTDYNAMSTHITFNSGTLTSPAANDIFYFGDVTLTGWRTAVTAGRPLLVGIAREDNVNDDTVTIVSGTIEYTRTK